MRQRFDLWALSKPRVWRVHRHSSAHFRIWWTDTDDRQKQQLIINRIGKLFESFDVSIVFKNFQFILIFFPLVARHEFA